MGFVEATKFTLVTNRTTGVTTKRISRDTKWKARYRDPKGRARSKTFDRKYDAEKFLARVDTDIQRDDGSTGSDAAPGSTSGPMPGSRPPLACPLRPAGATRRHRLDRLARGRAVRVIAHRARAQPEDVSRRRVGAVAHHEDGAAGEGDP